jgi:hypothetical protein
MKYKIGLILILVIAIVSSVYALYGGDTITYTIPTCNWLTTNISNAQLSEWNASPSCIEQSAGNFYCNCTNGETLSLTPKTNSVGNFNINITYYWLAQGGVSSGNVYFPFTPIGKNATINVTEIINQTQNVTCPTCNQTIPAPVEKIVEKVPQMVWYFVILLMTASSVLGWFLIDSYLKRRKNDAK